MSKKTKWLDRALLVSPYCFRLCKTEKSFHKELKRLKIPKKRWPQFVITPHANASTHFFKQPEGVGECVIVTLPVTKKHSTPQIHALLVHEAVHIWQACRDSIGEHNPGHETEAYAIQTISQRLMEAYE